MNKFCLNLSKSTLMADKIQILSDLKNKLKEKYGKSVKNIILFGSRATGDPEEYSDYDVLIVLAHEYSRKDEDEILDLCYELDLKYNILLDVHLISQKELNSIRGKQPVYLNAIKYGIYA